MTQYELAFREAIAEKRPYCLACYSPLHLSQGFNKAYAPLLTAKREKVYNTMPIWSVGKL